MKPLLIISAIFASNIGLAQNSFFKSCNNNWSVSQINIEKGSTIQGCPEVISAEMYKDADQGEWFAIRLIESVVEKNGTTCVYRDPRARYDQDLQFRCQK